jgi:hypothetical protein
MAHDVATDVVDFHNSVTGYAVQQFLKTPEV